MNTKHSPEKHLLQIVYVLDTGLRAGGMTINECALQCLGTYSLYSFTYLRHILFQRAPCHSVSKAELEIEQRGKHKWRSYLSGTEHSDWAELPTTTRKSQSGLLHF